MFLFFDTETTGLPRMWNAPVSDTDNWPRMVQLAWLVLNDWGQEISSGNRIVKPEGFIIPEEVSRVHGITTDIANKEGIPLDQVLLEFVRDLHQSEILVGHNISFDEKILGAEFYRRGVINDFFDRPKICTMQGSAKYCRIDNGRGGYKWPKLMELHEKLFDEGFDNAHDALADVKATARCFFELRQRGVL